MNSRASLIHIARVYLAQSRAFSVRARGFSFTLLRWASNTRRAAASMAASDPVQGDLFGVKQ